MKKMRKIMNNDDQRETRTVVVWSEIREIEHELDMIRQYLEKEPQIAMAYAKNAHKRSIKIKDRCQ